MNTMSCCGSRLLYSGDTRMFDSNEGKKIPKVRIFFLLICKANPGLVVTAKTHSVNIYKIAVTHTS
jgi:hypothetical protein